MARLTCPYCFEPSTRRRLMFRCVGSGPGRQSGCPPVLDEAYQAYLGSTSNAGAILPPVFAADGRRPRAVHIECGQVSLRRVCPHCHNHLAGDFCDVPSKLVAVVGAKNAGKSTYIAVLLHQLMNQVGKELQATLMPCDDRTRWRFREEFERPLFERGELLPITQSAATDLRDPLIYRLTVPGRWRFLRRRRALTLVLFDTAGEDLTSQESVDHHLRYLGVVDAIVFLVDTLHLPGARADVHPDSGDTSEQTGGDDPRDVISRVTELARAARGRAAPDRMPLPVAVTLTKIDALRGVVTEQSPLHWSRPRTGRLDLDDRRKVDAQLRALLERWQAGSVDRELSESYRTHELFGVSALGKPPRAGVVDPTGISPHRVEDPLLWLLHRFGMIRATGAGRS